MPISSLAARGWIAKEPEGWDRTSAYVGALCSHFSQCMISPYPPQTNDRHKSDRPWHQVLRPLLFSNSFMRSLTSHKNQISEVLWDGAYGLSSLSEKTWVSNHYQPIKVHKWTNIALSCLWNNWMNAFPKLGRKTVKQTGRQHLKIVPYTRY